MRRLLHLFRYIKLLKKNKKILSDSRINNNPNPLGIQYDWIFRLYTVLNLPFEDKENRKIGTMFVLGDEKKVMQLSRQMIINPFLGYSEKQRNILNPELEETIKEFSAIDGAFIINSRGAIVTAGRHLNATLDTRDFPAGLGSRHIAAAAITNVTKAVAIVISESSGNVSVFKNGKLFVTIKKPVN